MTYGEAALAKNSDPFWIYTYVIDVISGRDFEVLTLGERIFAVASRLVGEIGNGGFDQYFFNGGVVQVHEAAESLEAIGASRTAQLVRQAIGVAKLPEPIPPDYDYYQHATEEQRQRLNALDRQFYDSGLESREVHPRLVDYLREHTEEFT